MSAGFLHSVSVFCTFSPPPAQVFNQQMLETKDLPEELFRRTLPLVFVALPDPLLPLYCPAGSHLFVCSILRLFCINTLHAFCHFVVYYIFNMYLTSSSAKIGLISLCFVMVKSKPVQPRPQLQSKFLKCLKIKDTS